MIWLAVKYIRSSQWHTKHRIPNQCFQLMPSAQACETPKLLYAEDGRADGIQWRSLFFCALLRPGHMVGWLPKQ